MDASSKLLVGNWKMYGLRAALSEIDIIKGACPTLPADVTVAIAVPFTLLAAAAELTAGSGILIGAQDCHAATEGAYTGDVSAEQIADSGACFTIVGHSERRAGHGETSLEVAAKLAAAQRAGLLPILCVGETRQEREAGSTLDVIGEQLAESLPKDVDVERLVIAYEPVWCIGASTVPSAGDIQAVQRFIRAQLVDWFGQRGAFVKLLYGGSANADNAGWICALDDVDGLLFARASLTAQSFLATARAASAL